MFFGAGAQVAICCMYFYGFFTVSGTVVKLVRGCFAEVFVLAQGFMQVSIQ
jgi:hypothetical protein